MARDDIYLPTLKELKGEMNLHEWENIHDLHLSYRDLSRQLRRNHEFKYSVTTAAIKRLRDQNQHQKANELVTQEAARLAAVDLARENARSKFKVDTR
ncbi:hypothetical protein CONLIGDRAFT_677375 [Coniochaeta ligniaria NRRL 30616]|uniref:Uncharacterized protein n=1 Tax=Coniochaeta ligniaria NRRL 30616 TaxID=1408157 RepID=A0A1J7J0L3_9PEZI|nr:hypothetical protein CONLIGDRAFT_677375 [Coniochaeta ligniaria NRRL 30616]